MEEQAHSLNHPDHADAPGDAAMNPAATEAKATTDSGTASEEHQANASKFIHSTSLDDMHAIAEAALRKKMEAPPQWVFPEDGIPKQS